MTDYFPCAEALDCPFRTKAECREDVHHNYQQVPDMTPLMRIFRNLPDNKVVACRRLHVAALDSHPYEYPDEPTMRGEIISAEQAGQICLSATKQRIVYR